MGRVLNLDAVTVEMVTITKRNRDYNLRDDVPAEILLQRLALTPERYMVPPADEDPTAEQIDIALDGIAAYKADIAHLMGEIFRWSLPDTTDEELLSTFSIDEMAQIISLFTMRRGEESPTLPGATLPPSQKPLLTNRRRR